MNAPRWGREHTDHKPVSASEGLLVCYWDDEADRWRFGVASAVDDDGMVESIVLADGTAVLRKIGAPVFVAQPNHIAAEPRHVVAEVGMVTFPDPIQARAAIRAFAADVEKVRRTFEKDAKAVKKGAA